MKTPRPATPAHLETRRRRPATSQYNYNQPPQQYYPATPVNAQPYNPRQTQHAQATGRNDRQLPDGTWVDYKESRCGRTLSRERTVRL